MPNLRPFRGYVRVGGDSGVAKELPSRYLHLPAARGMPSRLHQVLLDRGRKAAIWSIVRLPEWWKGRVFHAFAQVSAFGDLLVLDPILRIPSFQTPLIIPHPLDAVSLPHPEMTFMIYGLLIFIQPPLKPMEHSILEITGLSKKQLSCSPVVFASPEV